MWKCGLCGTANPDGSEHCHVCGQRAIPDWMETGRTARRRSDRPRRDGRGILKRIDDMLMWLVVFAAFFVIGFSIAMVVVENLI